MRMDAGHEFRQESLGRRSFLVAAALPLLLAGCTGPSKEESPASEASSFPVTLKHVFGTTVLNAEPTRVATIGYASHDVCVELGVIPVGVPAYPERGYGVSLWFSKALSELNLAVPPTYRDDNEMPLQELRDLRPDVILAVHSGITRRQYDELSEIAPVVAYAGEPFNTDWRTVTATVGAALGRKDAASELVRQVEDHIVEASRGYSTLAGSSICYVAARSAPGADVRVFSADSNPMKILGDFGFRPAEALTAVEADLTPVRPDYGPAARIVPAAIARTLATDVNVISMRSDERADIVNTGVLDELPGAGEQSQVIAESTAQALALAEASPTGVRWATLEVLPQLARASYYSRGSN
jgi:iron complex transport system substrate-binding protein